MAFSDFNTSKLWGQLIFLIYLLFIFILLSFGYFLFQDKLNNLSIKPKFTQEQLAALTKKREKIRNQERNDNWDLVENGIHVKTGLKDDTNLSIVIGSCTSCHSAKLITQNKATRQGWKNMITWMQETQGLPDLGRNEPIILDYLAKHYAPQEIGRRKNLDVAAIEWYMLDLD